MLITCRYSSCLKLILFLRFHGFDHFWKIERIYSWFCCLICFVCICLTLFLFNLLYCLPLMVWAKQMTIELLILVQVHPYTYRNEFPFLHFNFSQDPYMEYDFWINKIGVDGLFTDFTGSLHRYQEWTSNRKDDDDDKTESNLLHKIALLVSSYEWSWEFRWCISVWINLLCSKDANNNIYKRAFEFWLKSEN